MLSGISHFPKEGVYNACLLSWSIHRADRCSSQYIVRKAIWTSPLLKHWLTLIKCSSSVREPHADSQSFESEDRLVSARLPGCPQMPVLSVFQVVVYLLLMPIRAMWSTAPFYGVTVWLGCGIDVTIYSLSSRTFAPLIFPKCLKGTRYTIRRKMNVHLGELYNVLTLCRCSLCLCTSLLPPAEAIRSSKQVTKYFTDDL